MKFCQCCVMPDTRPGLTFNSEGICAACESYKNRRRVNWVERRKELLDILEKYRIKDGSNYDCIIPVSGGKDSTYQVVKMLQMGMTPLCITFMASDLSGIGRKNIENLKSLGVDYIEFTANPVIKNKLARISLERVGDICWIEEVGAMSFVYRSAVQYKIPLIIWGENPDAEYGGPASKDESINRKWLERWGNLLGLSVNDLIGSDGIMAKDLIPYQYPSDEELENIGVTGIYLGYYLPWDGVMNNIISRGFGMSSYNQAIEGSIEDAGNTDDYRMGIHHYFKYLKYGYSRASDIVSQHIRAGRLTREDGIELVKRNDGKYPWTYLGKDLKEILRPLELSIEEFNQVCDKFTNREYFESYTDNFLKDKQGNLIKKNEFLIR